MATPIIGNNVMLYRHRDAEDDDVPFACMRSCELSIQTDSKNITSQTSAWFEESKPSISRWSISGDGLMILNNQWNYLYLLQSVKNRDKFTVKFVIDNGDALGITIFSGVVYLNSVSISAGYNAEATYTISLVGSAPYSLTGTTVDPSGVIIIAGSTIAVVQRTANDGDTTFTLTGYEGRNLIYASGGASVLSPIGSAGDYNSGVTWDSATATVTIYIPAVQNESFIFLIQ